MLPQANLFDFSQEKIEQRNREKKDEEKIMDMLGSFTADMLKTKLRNEGGHPRAEFGEKDTWRHYYLEECRRRGTKLLEQLSWPTGKDSLYVNIHTGCIRTLYHVATSDCYFADRHTIASQVWSVIEHWEPYDKANPNKYLLDYLKNEIKRCLKILEKRGAREYIKRTKEELKELQVKLINEQKRVDS